MDSYGALATGALNPVVNKYIFFSILIYTIFHNNNAFNLSTKPALPLVTNVWIRFCLTPHIFLLSIYHQCDTKYCFVKHVTFCATWYHLHNLKNVENTQIAHVSHLILGQIYIKSTTPKYHLLRQSV